MAQYDVDLRDYWRIFRKRKAIVILMVFLAGISSYGFAKLKEPLPIYATSAAVKIERFTNVADFLAGGYFIRGENIVTQAFIITSFPVLEKTAKQLGWIPRDLTSDDIRKSETAMAVIQRLKGMIEAKPESGTNIVNITVTSMEPQEAASVANESAEAFRNYNIEVKNRQTFDTKDFIEKQLDITSKQLMVAEENLRSFKESTAMVVLDSQTETLLGKLSEVEAEYDTVKRERQEIASQLEFIETAQQQPEKLQETFVPIGRDSAVQDLVGKLRDLAIRRHTLLFDYTEKNPQVIELDDQIKSVFSEIRKELSNLLQNTAAREKGLLEKLNRLRDASQSIPEISLQLERLERELLLQDSLYSQLKTRYQETQIKASGRVEEVSLIRPAVAPNKPTNIPSKGIIIFTGIVMGFIIGIVFTFVAETLDTSIGTIEDVENLLGIPVLGVIPFWEKDERRHRNPKLSVRSRDLVTHFDPKSLAAEAFRSLRTNMQFIGLDKKGKTFLVTSSFVQEGKTTNAVNLALSMAQAGSKVLLVEGDLRKPLVYKMFGIEKAPGLTDYVLGNYRWQEITVSITDLMLGEFEMEDILITPGLDNLNIMTAGTNPPNPSEILRSPRFSDFLKEALEAYDFIFIDAPPVLPVADATEIATMIDGVILVYKVGAIGRGILNRAKMTLDNVNANVLGVILNNIKPEMGPDYFKYHAHYYYGPSKEIQEEGGGLAAKTIRYGILLVAAALVFIGLFWADIF